MRFISDDYKYSFAMLHHQIIINYYQCHFFLSFIGKYIAQNIAYSLQRLILVTFVTLRFINLLTLNNNCIVYT